MAKLVRAQEQTMEDILASIRKMISDDDTRSLVRKDKAADERRPSNVRRLFGRDSEPPEATVEQTVEAAMEEVLAELNVGAAVAESRAEAAAAELDAEIGRAGAAAEDLDAMAEPGARASDRRAQIELETFEPQGLSAARHAVPASRAERPAERSANPLLSPRSDAAVAGAFNQLATTMFSGSARNMDEFVEDLLRPMLKGWLDNNLPPLVERMVREEIERVSRGRR